MKQKKMNKKLALSKSTIAHLGINIMGNAKGGKLDPSVLEPEVCGGSGNCTGDFCGSYPCETYNQCDTNGCNTYGC